MSLNAPASPKRLSALEMTFPSLEALGYSSEEDGTDTDPGPYAVSARGRTYRRTSSTSDYRRENSSEATSPVGRPTSKNVTSRSTSRPAARSESRKARKPRARLSSFHEYGDRPAPTSLSILSGLISGATRIIDRAYREQDIPVPDIDDPGLPKSKYGKEPKELKITNEVSSHSFHQPSLAHHTELIRLARSTKLLKSVSKHVTSLSVSCSVPK